MKDLINKHQKAITLLESIDWYQDKIKCLESGLEAFGSDFPNIVKNNMHEICIYNMCIERLKSRYDKLRGVD